MYAIIESGGKQYKVESGDVVDLELDAGTPGDDLQFDRVLMIGGDEGVEVGSPVLDSATVKGVALEAVRGPKIQVFKKKRRKGYKRLRGHRQNLVRVRIEEIQPGA